MNILFNANGCGLGPNGGSKTIIKSAETLQYLGHETDVGASVNNYTWHKPCVDIGVVSIFDALLHFDVVVNVSVWDVDSTIACGIKNKVWWMRGYESWVRGEQWLIDQLHKFVNAGGRMIVNATHLQDKLKGLGIDSDVCFAGLDLSTWENSFDINDKSKPYVVGGCKYYRHKTKNSEIVEKYSNFPMNIKQNMNDERLNDYYGDCHIYLAVSTNEGFHQSPAEAALCGCLVVYNNIASGGTQDYCSPETAEPFTTFEELVQAIENPDFSKVSKMQEVLKNKIGNREDNMKNFIELLKG